MEGIYREVYNYLSNVDKLDKRKYRYLISIYGSEIVDLVIEKMIDENENNVHKFDYYVAKIMMDFDNISNLSVLDIYMCDISRIPRLTSEENSMYANEAYGMVNELRALFNIMECKYERNIKSGFYSIVDEIEFSLGTSISYNIFERNNSRLRAINVLTNKLGRVPTDEEIAIHMNISVDKLHEIESAFMGTVSLYTQTFENDCNNSGIFADVLEDKSIDVFDEVCSKELYPLLIKVMNEYLDDTQKFILLNRFGFCGEVKTMQQLGNELGVSKQRIEQCQKKALSRIRRLAGKHLRDFL